ncbi:MAG: cellulose synthase family protein [Psychroflexus sp.]|uniref:cellulose synthase family protein n=1 Tax=Psychroflexus sp. S27 TaxID=1982757 RepID=UPI000C29CCBA|nr:cellulose synthase family protein [Psychroflexus sp. S27]PJX22764.1 glycosyl transferase family 2 [Psychroflexus sp. S27]
MILTYLILIIYALLLLIVFLYSLVQFDLYLKYRMQSQKRKIKQFKSWPKVTIQLPVFNENYVVERLINQVVQLDYPKEKIEFQVLDDSTDESMIKTIKLVENYQNLGINIKHIWRKNRVGFKAGALKEGLKKAEGEFIAVFDADFMPSSDWLKKTIPHFSNEKIGVVQTRWGHLNREDSLLTKIQAFALDFHFTLEQVGRNLSKHFINFNGTAGVWRKTCIIDAGNWQGDTLTEDLDLSYRAQLKSWEFVYLEGVVAEAELPAIMSATRSQQFRWNKGAAENFSKNFKKVLQSSEVSLRTKIHSFFHLLNSSMFLVVLLLAIISVPLLFIKATHPELKWFFYAMSILGISTILFLIVYWKSFKSINEQSKVNFFEFIFLFISFFSAAMGLSLHNSIAVLEGHFGKKSAFIRTPKLNNVLENNTYIKKQISVVNILEVCLAIYFAFGIYSAFRLNEYGLLFFHVMLFLGFSFVSYKSIFSK